MPGHFPLQLCGGMSSDISRITLLAGEDQPSADTVQSVPGAFTPVCSNVWYQSQVLGETEGHTRLQDHEVSVSKQLRVAEVRTCLVKRVKGSDGPAGWILITAESVLAYAEPGTEEDRFDAIANFRRSGPCTNIIG